MKDDSEIPDLLPRSHARPEGVRPDAARAAASQRAPIEPAGPSIASARVDAAPAPALLELEASSDVDELEFDLTRERGDDLPWDSPFRQDQGSMPERSTPAVLPAPTIELPPPRASVRPPDPSGPGTRAATAGLDLGLESTVWDLDDDLGDPRAAQLNVAVAMPKKDDVPWPVGRTPRPEEIEVSSLEITKTLGLPVADGWLSAPLYFWAARGALGRLQAETRRAEGQLAEAERERDGVLATLARSLRPTLSGTDRFRAAYDQIDQHLRVVDEARTALGLADAQGETGLAQVDVELESAKATVGLRARDAEERRAAAGSAERDLARMRAAHQRHVIERRNIVTRAQETSGPGADMPPELAGRFLAVEEHIKRADADLQIALVGHKQLESQLRLAEEEQRRALAHVRRIEGKREGLVLAQQGTLGGLSETLQTAERGHDRALAALGLAIVELHGEVPVDEGIRRRLLELDKAAATHAFEVERLVRARAAVDQDAYRRGGILLGVAALVMLVLLGWLFAG